jgi:hypothetical protein
MGSAASTTAVDNDRIRITSGLALNAAVQPESGERVLTAAA